MVYCNRKPALPSSAPPPLLLLLWESEWIVYHLHHRHHPSLVTITDSLETKLRNNRRSCSPSGPWGRVGSSKLRPVDSMGTWGLMESWSSFFLLNPSWQKLASSELCQSSFIVAGASTFLKLLSRNSNGSLENDNRFSDRLSHGIIGPFLLSVCK